jgi:hypothetical protein
MNDDHNLDYDTVTAADIADFTRHLADLRHSQPPADDPTERALLLARKADPLAHPGPTPRRNQPQQPPPGGARHQENSGASSG